MSALDRALLWAFGAGAVADVVTLALLLAAGGRELNPVVVWLVAAGGVALALSAKVAASAWCLVVARGQERGWARSALLAFGAVAWVFGACVNVASLP